MTRSPITSKLLRRDMGLSRARPTSPCLALKPKAKVGAIRAAIADVLATPACAEAARRISEAIAAESADDRAVGELEALAAGARVAALRRGTAR